MAAKYADIYRVGQLEACFLQAPLVLNFEIFTKLLWKINNLKFIKEIQKYFLIKKNPIIQFTIEIA